MKYLNLKYEICEVRLLWKRDKNDLKPIKNEESNHEIKKITVLETLWN